MWPADPSFLLLELEPTVTCARRRSFLTLYMARFCRPPPSPRGAIGAALFSCDTRCRRLTISIGGGAVPTVRVALAQKVVIVWSPLIWRLKFSVAAPPTALDGLMLVSTHSPVSFGSELLVPLGPNSQVRVATCPRTAPR